MHYNRYLPFVNMVQALNILNKLFYLSLFEVDMQIDCMGCFCVARCLETFENHCLDNVIFVVFKVSIAECLYNCLGQYIQSSPGNGTLLPVMFDSWK